MRTTIYYRFTRDDAIVPKVAYEGDAGWDLFVVEDTVVSHVINPTTGNIKSLMTDVPTGIAVEIPRGYYGRIVGRSSAMRKKNVQVMEGIIDSGFRGELLVGAIALPGTAVVLQRGESIGQLIISPIPDTTFVEREELRPSVRGEKGFGSSGN